MSFLEQETRVRVSAGVLLAIEIELFKEIDAMHEEAHKVGPRVHQPGHVSGGVATHADLN